MKKINCFIAFAIVAVLSMAFMPTDDFIRIEDAVKMGLVSYSVKGNKESTHYIKPVVITVKNLKNIPVKIQISNGMGFVPYDSSYQNLIVTQQELMALKPGGSLSVPIYAMCTENRDRGPSEGLAYKIGKPYSEKITKLTNYIEKKKLHDPLGQSAVWAMTCNTPLEDINGFDTTASRQLVKYVAFALGKPVPPPPAKDDPIRNYYCTNYKVTLNGEFEFNFHKTKTVTIAMFNKNNILVRELYRNQAETPGFHKVEYKFDATQYTEDYYYFRLIADDKVILNAKLEMKQDRN